MITRMREYFRGLKIVLLFVIVAFIATSVVYFGAASLQDGPRGDTVARVNGETVPLDRFRRVYQNYVEMYRQAYRERFTPELAERLGLAQQVLNDLIHETLVVQQAEREGLRATDEEVRLRIQAIPAFQQDGRFSRDRYLTILRQVRIEPGVFEAEQRRELQRRKMEALVRDGVKVTDEEVRQAWLARHERVRAAWAVLEPRSLLPQVKVAEDGAEAYLKAHQARFTRPERRRVLYALASTRALAEPVADADAQAYYRDHPAEFERPPRVRVAHVLVRVPPVGGSQAEERSRARVEEVIRRARAGEDFAKLAREVSEDAATAPRGGELGFMGRGEMVKPFEEAAFALRAGEVSPQPVRTPFGYHAIKVLEAEEGGTQPFKDVAGAIKAKLLAERAERAAARKAEEARGALQAASDFGAEARRLGLEVREAVLARGDGLEGIGRDPALEDAVFGLAVSGVSAPVKTAAGSVIVKLLETQPGGVPPLGQIKAEVLEAMRQEEAEKLAVARAAALAQQAAAGDFVQVARREGFATGETPAFSRAEPPKGPSGSLPGAVLLAALQTPASQVSKPVTTTSGVYLVKTLDRQPPDPAAFDAERAELGRQLLETKRAQVWQAWLRDLRAAAQVETTMDLGAPAAR